ncbi:MAG: hypothetical protein LWX11_09065 [Firmicutes bacterium]|nr:hypothetical protein [Bacillota bacterium]
MFMWPPPPDPATPAWVLNLEPFDASAPIQMVRASSPTRSFRAEALFMPLRPLPAYPGSLPVKVRFRPTSRDAWVMFGLNLLAEMTGGHGLYRPSEEERRWGIEGLQFPRQDRLFTAGSTWNTTYSIGPTPPR